MAQWEEALELLGEYLTQEAIADLLGVSRVTVSNWSRGETRPRAEHRLALVETARKQFPQDMPDEGDGVDE